MIEQWKPVVGYEDFLAVSNLGNVCNIGKMLPNGTYQPERARKISKHRTGYSYIVQKVGGKQKFLLIHRLVAEAFIPNPDNLPEVNHKDLDKSNCAVTNLEWCTRKENVEHAKANNAIKNFDSMGLPKRAVLAIDKQGKETIYESVNACARALGSTSGNVCSCLKGRHKTCKGYTIEYV